MRLYAESSAVLSWLLEEKRGGEVGAVLARARTVCTSDLTLVECDRTLIRAVAAGSIRERDAGERRAVLDRAVGRWVMIAMGADIVARARRRFPVEPVRALDALHLAAALAVSARMSDLAVASLDSRIRDNAAALGMQVLP
ncbi:MAG: PIN domain-containing protein [Deltaproteobacteria bacterium]|nr:PIN domain-containing protein [Deltaproteobacteria bacterium]